MADTDRPKTEYLPNIVYAVHDGIELKGDLYVPEGPGPHPLIVNVHGGYWRRGSRDTYQYWGPHLGERGYAGFTISYRLTKQGRKTFPEAVHDVRAAVQFMRGNARNFRLDPARFALWGNSAGAQLAALTALAGDSPAFAGAYAHDSHASVSSSVKVLIGVYGIYDLLAQWRHAQVTNPDENLVASYLGCSPTQDRRRYFEASPLSYATTANNKTAIYLSWGTEDDVVDCTREPVARVPACAQAGWVQCAAAASMPGATHYWLSDPDRGADESNRVFSRRAWCGFWRRDCRISRVGKTR